MSETMKVESPSPMVHFEEEIVDQKELLVNNEIEPEDQQNKIIEMLKNAADYDAQIDPVNMSIMSDKPAPKRRYSLGQSLPRQQTLLTPAEVDVPF